jgi:hypothetical protein
MTNTLHKTFSKFVDFHLGQDLAYDATAFLHTLIAYDHLSPGTDPSPLENLILDLQGDSTEKEKIYAVADL